MLDAVGKAMNLQERIDRIESIEAKRRDGLAANAERIRSPIIIESYLPSTLTHKVGVVIGCYKWPSVARLQCRLIRRTCGPVAILLSEDCTPGKSAEYSRIAREECASLWPNAANIGHGGGDLACLYKGPQWAGNLGLEYIAKLSQRFLVTKANWLQNSVQELVGSGKALATRLCRGKENCEYRTEAVMLDVAKWSAPHVKLALTPRRLHKGLSAEQVFDAVVREHFNGEYHPWSLFGEDRADKAPGVLFRLSADIEDYRRVAAELSVELDDNFHADGWAAENTAGEYRY